MDLMTVKRLATVIMTAKETVINLDWLKGRDLMTGLNSEIMTDWPKGTVKD